MPEQNVNPERYPQYQEEELSSFFDLKNLTLKLVLYWPWFVVSIIACIILALVYLRFQVPVYSINGSVIIKEDKTKGRSASIQNASPMALMDLGSFSMTNNFNTAEQDTHQESCLQPRSVYQHHAEVPSAGSTGIVQQFPGFSMDDT